MSARPVQAAFASAGTFAIGAALPLLAAFLTPVNWLEIVVSVLSLVFLALLGGVSAFVGGAPIVKAVARVISGARLRWRQLQGLENYLASLSKSLSAERKHQFRQLLGAAGVRVRFRHRKGDKIDAACGQLRRSQLVELHKN